MLLDTFTGPESSQVCVWSRLTVFSCRQKEHFSGSRKQTSWKKKSRKRHKSGFELQRAKHFSWSNQINAGQQLPTDINVFEEHLTRAGFFGSLRCFASPDDGKNRLHGKLFAVRSFKSKSDLCTLEFYLSSFLLFWVGKMLFVLVTLDPFNDIAWWTFLLLIV